MKSWVFSVFKDMEVSPSVVYTWRRFGRWGKLLGDRRPSSLIMLPKVKLLLEDVLPLWKGKKSLLHTSKSLLSAQDNYRWRTSPDDDSIKLFPKFVPVLQTTDLWVRWGEGVHESSAIYFEKYLHWCILVYWSFKRGHLCRR